MSKSFVLRGFIASLVVTIPVGAVVLRFLPGWSGLVKDVGAGGAWTLVFVSHLIYSWVIGLATFFFLTLLQKLKYQGSAFGAGLSAAITVAIVDIVSVRYSIDFGGLLVFLLAWVSWVVNLAVLLSMKLLGALPAADKSEGAG